MQKKLLKRVWDKIIKPSTRSFFAAAKIIPGYSAWDRLHGYVYARWTYLYISVGTGEHRLSKLIKPIWKLYASLAGPKSAAEKQAGRTEFADGYHGKVLLHEDARRMVTLNRPIDLRNLEQVIPYSKARDIVMLNPDHIVALECPCRSARAKPCLPLDVCLVIGEPFAGFVLEHHSRRAKSITQQQAVEILQSEHKRGHVHHAFFKDAMLGRFYAICNCCSCCCAAMHAYRNATPMLAPSGYRLQVDHERCTDCGLCAKACPFDALALQTGKLVLNEEKCMGCGVCVPKCKRGAAVLVRDAGKGEPLAIQELMARAAQS